MNYISEHSNWLSSRNILESPYSEKTSNSNYQQYPMPKNLAFIDILVEKLVNSTNSLLVLTEWHFLAPDDWKHYKPNQISFVELIQSTATQHPNFKKELGFTYEPNHLTQLISNIKTIIELGWSAYLYTESNNITVHFWEGDLIDTWSNSKATINEISQIIL